LNADICSTDPGPVKLKNKIKSGLNDPATFMRNIKKSALFMKLVVVAERD